MRKISKDAFVIVGHCPKHKGIYGITVDKIRQGLYTFVWAFKLNKETAQNEGFSETSVNGSVTEDDEYPGCPYCGSKRKVICGCGAVICYNGEQIVKCPHCGCSGKASYAESFNLKGGNL